MNNTFQLNQQVPDFTLQTVTGGDFHFSRELEDHEDQWFLLVYFRGSWCPACQAELQEFEESKAYFSDKHIQLVTITHDQQEGLEKMMQEKDISFPVLIDSDFEFLKAYGVHYHGADAPYEDHGTHGEPAYFLTNQQGELLYQQRQTSPFGRPHPKELLKTIKYIQKNLK